MSPSISKKLRFRVLNEAGFRCYYCGRSAPDVVLEVDHIHPRSKGGTHRRANLRAACFDCNRGKRDWLLLSTEGVAGLPQTWSWAPFAMCGDSCPQCPIDLIVTTPRCLLAREDGCVKLQYGCDQGHEWATWWHEPTALQHARDTQQETPVRLGPYSWTARASQTPASGVTDGPWSDAFEGVEHL